MLLFHLQHLVVQFDITTQAQYLRLRIVYKTTWKMFMSSQLNICRIC